MARLPRAGGLGALLGALAIAATARGEAAPEVDDPAAASNRSRPPAVPNDPVSIAGIEETDFDPSDVGLGIASGVLFVPRNVIDYAFRGADLAATLVNDRQLVPRYRDLFSTPSARLYVFPTLFAETDAPVSVGLRMIFDSRRIGASQRVGFGGLNQVEAETRLVLKGKLAELPAVLSLESYYELVDNRRYYGIGLVPRSDLRNRFVDGTPYEFGYYTERRVRHLASGGLRLSENIELLMSTSLYRRQLETTATRGAEAVTAVFEPGTIPGLSTANPYLVYSEVAARFDSRRIRTRPSPGWLFETYVGGAHPLGGADLAYMRLGARAGFAKPVMRQSNLFALRFTVDGVTPAPGSELPFVELEHQTEYRGFDTRRDYLAMLSSADYTWLLAPALGMRFFADALTVAPSLRSFGAEQLQNMRLALGIGLDAFSGENTLASMVLGVSGDGVRFVATFGAPATHGDRQHRK
ncbi:MAG: hypothetical protein FJ096_11340 [Deltaproteobacteria bacterium]|nr:hypothetical protein [Deltaproteobacteria bacterium]